MLQVKRKRRSDRNQIIYYIQHVDSGDYYIGLTSVSFNGNVKRTLKRRMQKHVQRALAEDKNWALSCAIRKHGAESFVYDVVEVVRGKKAAHAMETELINTYKPVLNTFGIK